MRSVGVVVPAYRPDVELLAEYVASLRSLSGVKAIRIELDAPRPDTGVPDLAERFEVVSVAVADRRRGKGAAITAGFDALDTDVRAYVDADGSVPPSSVADVVRPVATGEASVAVGSRRHPDATIASHQGVVRRVLGDGFAWVARHALGIDCYDFQCGAKAVSREAWTRVGPLLTESGFAWDVEFVAMADALGFTVREVPVVWEDQPGSKVDPVGTTVELARALVGVGRRVRTISGEHTGPAGPQNESPASVERSGEE